MKKFAVFFCFFVSFALVILRLYHLLILPKISSDFDKEPFLSNGYTKDEIMLFCDIGFLYDRIWKWETDIKVEIVDIEKLNQKDIDDIDSIINILTPLIYPIKMERVEKKGNLKVHRKAEKIPTFGLKQSEVGLGIARINPLNLKHLKISRNIIRVDIYVAEYSFGTGILIHEFLHAIGLGHASKPHKLHFVMSSREAPNIFKSIDESYAFSDIPYYISEQEKQVIRMLYSSGVKSGVQRDDFIQKMELDY